MSAVRRAREIHLEEETTQHEEKQTEEEHQYEENQDVE